MLVARPDGTDRTRWTSINACLPPAVAFDGQRVVTSEASVHGRWPQVRRSSVFPTVDQVAKCPNLAMMQWMDSGQYAVREVLAAHVSKGLVRLSMSTWRMGSSSSRWARVAVKKS